MGTCGRGNGAEEVFHALNEAIQRSGLDVLLAGVGCFGSCFQEPLVSVRLPGDPLVILRRVQANDAGRILESLSTRRMPPDLIYCKIEEWDHITAHVKYGQGYPEIRAVECDSVFQGTEEDCPAQLRADQSRETSRSTSRSAATRRFTRC